MSLPQPFPSIINDEDSENLNPGIRLFGRRFFKDQNEVELLSEFLSVLFSKKWINNEEMNEYFPSIDTINRWKNSGEKLKYKPPVKLNLKLFAFLGNSRVDTRHQVHNEHYKKLYQNILEQLHVSSGESQEIIEWIENLLKGYKGAGFNRTWCAQTFYPISDSLISQETIWNESYAKNNKIYSWEEVIFNFKTHFRNKRVFFARGGELLYLQLCNLFTIEPEDVLSFTKKADIVEDSKDLKILHKSIQQKFGKLKGINTEPLDKIVDFIENLDQDTYKQSNKDADKLSCQWCPRESWQEGYLFALEIDRLLQAALDPVERLDLLVTGCVLQVMRSLCAQSMRYIEDTEVKGSNVLGYMWMFTSSN